MVEHHDWGGVPQRGLYQAQAEWDALATLGIKEIQTMEGHVYRFEVLECEETEDPRPPEDKEKYP
jgi:hypothetical protein